jgi:hypothetical protein
MIKVKELNSTYNYLRNATCQWKTDMKHKYGNRCVITGTKDNLRIHHLQKSFVEIIEETFTKAELKYKNSIYHYTIEERDKLSKICLEIHRQYEGVPIEAKLHKRFHDQYGVTGYTEDNFKEFKRKYKSRVRQSLKSRVA